MTTMKRSPWIWCVGLLLSGCFGTSKPTRYFVLELPGRREVIEQVTRPAPPLHITVKSLPAYLDRGNFVTQVSHNEIEVSDLLMWGEPLSNGISRVLLAGVTHHLASQKRVSDREYQGPIAITIDIETLICSAGDLSCSLAITWRLECGSKEIVRDSMALRQTILSGTPESQVVGIGELLDKVAERLANTIGSQNC